MVVLIERKRSPWVLRGVILGVLLALVGAGWWAWSWQPDDLMTEAPVAATGGAGMTAAPDVVAATPADPLGASGPPVDANAWREQAQQAEQAVVGGAGGMVPAPPIQGVLTERPSYVSLIEWMALKSAAQQHADPDAELTRLVNFLRFMRLRDVLDALPQDAAAQRQLLADALLSELPTHVQQGNIGRTEALGLQAQWLAIVQPDEQLRAEMVRQEAARLNPGQ